MDEYQNMLARNVVKGDDDNLAHDPSLVQKNRVVQAQNLLQFQLDDQAQSLFQFQQDGQDDRVHTPFQQQMSKVAQAQILFELNSVPLMDLALSQQSNILAQVMVLSQRFYGLSYQVDLHIPHVRQHQLQLGTCRHSQGACISSDHQKRRESNIHCSSFHHAHMPYRHIYQLYQRHCKVAQLARSISTLEPPFLEEQQLASSLLVLILVEAQASLLLIDQSLSIHRPVQIFLLFIHLLLQVPHFKELHQAHRGRHPLGGILGRELEDSSHRPTWVSTVCSLL